MRRANSFRRPPMGTLGSESTESTHLEVRRHVHAFKNGVFDFQKALNVMTVIARSTTKVYF